MCYICGTHVLHMSYYTRQWRMPYTHIRARSLGSETAKISPVFRKPRKKIKLGEYFASAKYKYPPVDKPRSWAISYVRI